MTVLVLNLKRKWFNMILSGEKKEEYREIKPYWTKRLDKKIDIIEFRNGYKKDSPKFRIKFKNVTVGKARGEWSDNWKGDVYIIKLGKIY